MIGSLIQNEMVGLNINQMFLIIFNFGSGIFINNNSTNVIIKFLTWISPFRYASEAMMRTFLTGKANVDQLFEHFNYTLGTRECVNIGLVFMVIFFVFSFLSVQYKSYKLFKK